jgi:hypothetical protein
VSEILRSPVLAVLMREHGVTWTYTRDAASHDFPLLTPIDPMARGGSIGWDGERYLDKISKASLTYGRSGMESARPYGPAGRHLSSPSSNRVT